MKTLPTLRTYRVLAFASDAAYARRAKCILAEHILHGLIMEGHGMVAEVLRNAGVTLNLPRRQIDSKEDYDSLLATGHAVRSELRGEAKQLMAWAAEEAKECREKLAEPGPPFARIGPEHVLLALTKAESTTGGRVLKQQIAKVRLTPADLRQQLLERIQTRATCRHSG